MQVMVLPDPVPPLQSISLNSSADLPGHFVFIFSKIRSAEDKKQNM